MTVFLGISALHLVGIVCMVSAGVSDYYDESSSCINIAYYILLPFIWGFLYHIFDLLVKAKSNAGETLQLLGLISSVAGALIATFMYHHSTMSIVFQGLLTANIIRLSISSWTSFKQLCSLSSLQAIVLDGIQFYACFRLVSGLISLLNYQLDCLILFNHMLLIVWLVTSFQIYWIPSMKEEWAYLRRRWKSFCGVKEEQPKQE